MAVIYEGHQADGLKWHKTHTKFHDDQFRHSSNIIVITSTNRTAAVFVLLMGGIYEIHLSDGARWHYIDIQSFDHQLRHSSNIKVNI
jgi:hypothetical protein